VALARASTGCNDAAEVTVIERLVTPAYRGTAKLAQTLPRPVVEGLAPRLARAWARKPSEKRRLVERHQRRIEPGLEGVALARRVGQVYASYGRYYAESFRLPAVSVDELDRRITLDGYEHMEKARAGGGGTIVVLPHLGSWEWVAYWYARVKGEPITAVVERLEPPELFEWFTDFRRRIGMDIVPLGPGAASAVTRALKAGHVLALLADRDVGGDGVPVTFFGERTTLPGGPATLALRTGAPLVPAAVYDRSHGRHHAVVKPPLPVERQGRLRDDIVRVTQDIAHVLEELIRAAPEQWHLLQPNWPSDPR
jgi:phosphatidylinositol dimannoside acyltransferase